MAKSAAKPGSIPTYEEELQKLSAELKALKKSEPTSRPSGVRSTCRTLRN
jgi:hypothetical protein